MFLIQAVVNNGFLFEIEEDSGAEYNLYGAMTEEEMLEKLQCSREHCEEGRCREADKVVSDMRGKYNL